MIRMGCKRLNPHISVCTKDDLGTCGRNTVIIADIEFHLILDYRSGIHIIAQKV